jgi:hypothetical protein
MAAPVVEPAASMAETGRLIAGRYRLVHRIAVGGMGVVWEGWDELLARQVAVKQLLTQPGLSEADALLARNRVIREARITARLHHPHAVTIYDVVDDGDSPCLIMQFVPSDSLNTVLRDQGTLPPSRVGRIGADLASALRAAHEVGIVHRDVKPGNVLISGDGSAKLTDFGISHAVGDVTLTSTGMVSGTPAYLAPEVARGGESGFAADVFSLGATMYASLEGTPPFGLDANPMAVLHRVASGRLIPPQRSGPLTPLLLAMMAPDPADRPTMSEVTRSLTLPQITAPPPAARSAAGPAVGLGVLGVGPGVGPTSDRVAARTLPVSRPDLLAALPAAEPRTPAPVESARVESARVESARVESARVDAAPPALAALMGPERGGPERGGQAPADDAPAGGAPARRRTGAAIAAAAVVIVALLMTGFLLLRGDDSGQAPVAATTVEDTVATENPAPTTASEQSSETDSTSQVSSSAAAESPSTEPPSTEPPSTEPTADELAAAVSGYYALMPGNTDAGWALLTPSFQSSIAQNRDYYDSFWSGIAQVGVSDVTGTPPGTVEATVTYTFTDGSVSVERTAYQLVDDGGTLKIDSSTVLSSRAG